MKPIIDYKKQIKHLETCTFKLNSEVETLYFKDYILKVYKVPWHVLSDGILLPEKEKWTTRRKTDIYNFNLLID